MCSLFVLQASTYLFGLTGRFPALLCCWYSAGAHAQCSKPEQTTQWRRARLQSMHGGNTHPSSTVRLADGNQAAIATANGSVWLPPAAFVFLSKARDAVCAKLRRPADMLIK